MKNFYRMLTADKRSVLKKRGFALVIAFLIIIGVISLVRARIDISSKARELEAVTAQYEEQLAMNNELANLLNNSDDQYIEEKAREELDMVFPGERVYIIRPGE